MEVDEPTSEPANIESEEPCTNDSAEHIVEPTDIDAYDAEEVEQHITETDESSNDKGAKLVAEQSKLKADDVEEAEQINIETDEFSNSDSTEPNVEQPNFETDEPSNGNSAHLIVKPTDNEPEDSGYAEDSFSGSSSEFIEVPEPLDGYNQEDSILEPYERPSAPEPPYIEDYDADYDFSGHHTAVEEEVDMQPRVRLPPCAPTITATTTATPSDDASEEANHHRHRCYEVFTSPYCQRSTAYSWTGLETTSWAVQSYIDHTNNTLDTYAERDARTGRCHGYLSRCSWPTHASRVEAEAAAAATGSAPLAVKKEEEPVPAPEQLVRPAGVVITVTCPEGETRWLGEDPTEYEDGSDVFDFRRREYGHRCRHEPCTAFFEDFGWFQWPKFGTVVTPEAEAEAHGVATVAVVQAVRAIRALQVSLAAAAASAAAAAKATEAARVSKSAADQEVRGMQMRGYMDRQEEPYAGPDLETIDEDEELVIGEDAGIEDCAVADDESDIEVDHPLLDRIEAMVYKSSAVFREIAAEQERDRAEAQRAAAAKMAEAAAEVAKVSLWDRDPLSTSKLSWADIDELDDEPAPTEAVAVVNTETNEVSFWDRDPFYISNTKWGDLIEEDDY